MMWEHSNHHKMCLFLESEIQRQFLVHDLVYQYKRSRQLTIINSI